MNLPYVLPYVIDNRAHTLADVLNDLLHSDARMLSIRVHTLDVATAYVNVGAFDLVQDGLERLASLRLLLGSEPGARPMSEKWVIDIRDQCQANEVYAKLGGAGVPRLRKSTRTICAGLQNCSSRHNLMALRGFVG